MKIRMRFYFTVIKVKTRGIYYRFKNWVEFMQYRFWIWVIKKYKVSLKMHMTVALPIKPAEAGKIIDYIAGGGEVMKTLKESEE